MATLVIYEMRNSRLQSWLLSESARGMTYTLAEGASPNAAFPHSGPYDERLGYKALPQYINSLEQGGFTIARQARASATLASYIDSNGHAIYREKDSAGLTLLDRKGRPLYSQRIPQRVFERYEEVPELLAQTLTFIEDRKLLDEVTSRNPAVDWPRFIGAALYRLPPGMTGGGGASTLATQIEKLRHSRGGRTHSPMEKLLQMRAASLRAYLDGPDTRAMRRQILATYLNTAPLGSRAGLGEVIGLGDAMWAWYGVDFRELSRLLQEKRENLSAEARARRGLLYKQALSLMAAQRRPAFYLGKRRTEVLPQRTEYLLGLLREAGVIDGELYASAMAAPLKVTEHVPTSFQYPAWQRKAADGVRIKLMKALNAPNLYALDRLDLSAYSTLDAGAQSAVTAALARMTGRDGEPAQAPYLLTKGRPEDVVYSVVLYERGSTHNVLRLRADSLNSRMDLNSGARLDLGSTAKLRTVIGYLQIVSELHERLANQSPPKLYKVMQAARDPITRWAAGYLLEARNHSLGPMIDAALQRRYSGSPNQLFYTGGGEHVFGNFDPIENNMIPTVERAFTLSVNLSFIRLMSDLVQYEVADAGVDLYGLLTDRENPRREKYLRRFADEESLQFLDRYYAQLQGLSPDEILRRQLRRCNGRVRCSAVTYRMLRPRAEKAEFAAVMNKVRPGLSLTAQDIDSLYERYDKERWTLEDKGLLARIHPLELWVAAYLQTLPNASRQHLREASVQERSENYRWLMKTRNSIAQNQRIMTVLEQDAFARMTLRWRQQGYPFASLVPSLATALGTSGDRPDALAALMGVIVNDGVLLPNMEVSALQFAADTPYETWLTPDRLAPRRVFAPEVAVALRRLLNGVVAEGTGQRLRDGLADGRGGFLQVGGKTGTSDQRSKVYDEHGRLIGERPMNRTATFAFTIGDRYFGTITACVLGPQSAEYEFNSSFAVQLLKDFAPDMAPLWADMPAAPPLRERDDGQRIALGGGGVAVKVSSAIN